MACLNITKCREILARCEAVLAIKQARRNDIRDAFVQHTGKKDAYDAYRYYAAYGELSRSTLCNQAFILDGEALKLVSNLLHQKVPVLPMELLKKLSEEDDKLRKEMKELEQREKFVRDVLILLEDLEQDAYNDVPTKGKCNEQQISDGSPPPSEAGAGGCSDSEGGASNEAEGTTRRIDDVPF